LVKSRGSNKTFFHKCGEYQQGVTGVAEIQEYINELVKNINIEKDIGLKTQMQKRLTGRNTTATATYNKISYTSYL
jgi:hypothetical protein